jgi:hypothetical protein
VVLDPGKADLVPVLLSIFKLGWFQLHILPLPKTSSSRSHLIPVPKSKILKNFNVKTPNFYSKGKNKIPKG